MMLHDMIIAMKRMLINHQYETKCCMIIGVPYEQTAGGHRTDQKKLDSRLF